MIFSSKYRREIKTNDIFQTGQKVKFLWKWAISQHFFVTNVAPNWPFRCLNQYNSWFMVQLEPITSKSIKRKGSRCNLDNFTMASSLASVGRKLFSMHGTHLCGGWCLASLDGQRTQEAILHKRNNSHTMVNLDEEDVFQVFLCHFHFRDSDKNGSLPAALAGKQLLGCHPCLRGWSRRSSSASGLWRGRLPSP